MLIVKGLGGRTTARFVGTMLTGVALILGSGLVSAGPTQCTGAMSNTTVNGDLTVPSGATCSLDHVTVTGNVTVQANGSFFITTGTGMDTVIGGNVSANGCNRFDIESTGGTGRIAIGGSLTIANCTGSGFYGGRGNSIAMPMNVLVGGNVKCSNNNDNCVFDYVVFGGNVDCSANDGGCVLQSPAIAGNVTMNNNTNGANGISNGIIGGDLKGTLPPRPARAIP